MQLVTTTFELLVEWGAWSRKTGVNLGYCSPYFSLFPERGCDPLISEEVAEQVDRAVSQLFQCQNGMWLALLVHFVCCPSAEDISYRRTARMLQLSSSTVKARVDGGVAFVEGWLIRDDQALLDAA